MRTPPATQSPGTPRLAAAACGAMAIASLVAGLIGMLTMWPTNGFGEPSGSYELALACLAWGVAGAVLFWVMAAVLNWMAALYELLSRHLGDPESATEGRHSVPPP